MDTLYDQDSNTLQIWSQVKDHSSQWGVLCSSYHPMAACLHGSCLCGSSTGSAQASRAQGLPLEPLQGSGERVRLWAFAHQLSWCLESQLDCSLFV